MGHFQSLLIIRDLHNYKGVPYGYSESKSPCPHAFLFQLAAFTNFSSLIIPLLAKM